MAQFHKLTIKEVHKETDKCVTISFDVPSDLKDAFSFKAGQYLTLKTTLNGKEVRRDYSICVAPNTNELKVAVKEVAGGAFSHFANNTLKAGDTLEVATPNGRFTFEADNSKSRTVAAFAAGSGITPIIGIAKTILKDEPNSKFVLAYGNKTPLDTIFLDELKALENEFNGRLVIQWVFSQAQADNALFGRIDKSAVNYTLKHHCQNGAPDAFYLCGPEEMIHTATDALKENGIDENKIFFELFTAGTPAEPVAVEAGNGNAKVKVIVDDEEFEFEMSQKQSILDAALKEDIDVPYSCQGGICSSCIARLTEGEAIMRQNSILTDSELAEGLVLTCQAHPTTPTIVVDYDDV
ncbi:ferredoxin--NADP reductase [Mangrovimonas aestuarii]|uniref:ferredoxin--NADP reductase n=1 Tax=Mangrovimonas aestuarii TaxID=3018443 RepID=UPI0023798A8C|nr:ferredoxin--NADP reductase [Mangrovimonas aestuarii]